MLDASYGKVIVKAGANNLAGDFANTIFVNPSAGQTVWADTNGNGAYNPDGQNGDKNISHIIFCPAATVPDPVAPKIEVTKAADKTAVKETGEDVTYTFSARNTGTVPATLTELKDDQFGTLPGDDDCQVGTTLQPSQSCDFTFKVRMAGAVGTEHVNVFIATAENSGKTYTDISEEVKVTFTKVIVPNPGSPEIEVYKNADKTGVKETGEYVTYTFKVENKSTVPVRLTKLSDDKLDSVSEGDSGCKVGTWLQPTKERGDSCEFTVATHLSGTPGASHVNTFTATAEDEHGNPATDSTKATVTFTDVKPGIAVTKDADKASVAETGGDVTYTFTVRNSGDVRVELTELVDDKFGTLDGDGDCEVGITLKPGDFCEFSVTKHLSGAAGAEHVNVFTAKAKDTQNNTATHSDNATVTFTDVTDPVIPTVIPPVVTPEAVTPGVTTPEAVLGVEEQLPFTGGSLAILGLAAATTVAGATLYGVGRRRKQN